MHIKIQELYLLTPVRGAVSTKTKATSVGRDVEESEPLALLVGREKGAARRCSKIKNETTM